MCLSSCVIAAECKSVIIDTSGVFVPWLGIVRRSTWDDCVDVDSKRATAITIYNQRSIDGILPVIARVHMKLIICLIIMEMVSMPT